MLYTSVVREPPSEHTLGDDLRTLGTVREDALRGHVEICLTLGLSQVADGVFVVLWEVRS